MTRGADVRTVPPMIHTSDRLTPGFPISVAIALTGIFARGLAFFAALAIALDEAFERGRQRRALSRLEHHHLRDIGITRAEATRESNKLFWRR